MAEKQDESIKEAQEKWTKFAEHHIEGQSRNPFNDDVFRPEHTKPPSKTDSQYGKPPPGSLTEKRGIKAHAHISSEVVELCNHIKTTGVPQEDGTVTITFGQLFAIYNKISNKLVGILIRARKHGFLTFPGEMLYQRQDEKVVITLLSCPDDQLMLMYK